MTKFVAVCNTILSVSVVMLKCKLNIFQVIFLDTCCILTSSFFVVSKIDVVGDDVQ